MPNVQRNYGGFDYSNYLKTLEIYGTINAENIEILKHNNIDRISIKINEYRQNIKEKISNTLDSKVWPIYFSLILADSSYIEKDIRDDFANCSLSHILAVSGMHISYIIIGVSVLLNKILGKRCGRIVTIIVLILYTVLTGFTPSLARAIIMGIMTIISNLIYRRNDTWNFLFFSLFCILIYNPYLITNIGLQYSYIATIGIIIFNKHILKILNKRSNKLKKIKESISVLISAQIALFPLIIFHTNKFGIYFIITNLIVGFIIGPIIILGFILLIKGADFLVDGASSLARKFNIPDIIIGLTIVSIGTSMPELFVSSTSTINGSSDMAIGNIIGSNLCNLLMILGISTIIKPVKFQKETRLIEIPICLIITIIFAIFCNTSGEISRIEAIVLIFLFSHKKLFLKICLLRLKLLILL